MTHQLAYRLLQKEGSASKAILKGVGGAAKGFLQSGSLMAKHMAEAGVKSPVALGLAKVAPYAAAGWAGKKAYDSPTGQRVRYKIQEIRARRAMRNQGGY